MIWMDVDIGLATVPVNIMPLIDDIDFKTIEDGVVFNQAGLALFWNFTTTAGVTTVTAVTPTSAGDYDWTDFGTSGMYGIEIPASGGASANNNVEGFGHFTGVATGILPWTGPIIGFRAAALNNLLIDDSLSATRGLSGTALPDAVADAAGGLIISDAGGLDADAMNTAAVRLTAARAQVLTDWINDGRLDLILDIIAADVVNIDGAAMRGTDGVDTATMRGTDGVDTATMRGTDNAATEAKQDIIDTNVDQIETAVITNAAGVDISADIAAVKVDTAAILVDTDTTIPALIAALNDIAASDILTSQLTESYAADGSAPTLTQALMLIQQALTEFAIAGTSNTVKKLDGSTTAAIMTLNDATNPTSSTRSS